MMTSLWKKLDFTLNQIRCMQNSPSVSNNQRLRTRNGIMNMRRQRAQASLQSPASSGLLSITPSSGPQIPSPLPTPQGMLGHSTPVCYSSLQARPSPLCVSQPQSQERSRVIINVNRDSPLQVVVPDRRFHPGQLSPGRRKCDSPRRRGGVLSGQPSAAGRGPPVSSVQSAEQQSEGEQETVTENFPQMVIDNAREKILSDKTLQEKLAENINKFLGSENNPQTMKQATSSTMLQDQSIDEILGLQGEIHMTDDAIRDILEQTESDPAFQALFDLFDYGKNRNSESDAQDADASITDPAQEIVLWEGELTEPNESSSDICDQVTSCEDSTSGVESAARPSKTRNELDAKSKKSRKTPHPLPSTSRTLQTSSTSHITNELLLTARPSASGTGPPGARVPGSNIRTRSASRSVLTVAEGTRSKDSSPMTSDRDVLSSLLCDEEISMDVDLQVETVVSSQSKVQSPALLPDNQKNLDKGHQPSVTVENNTLLSACDTTESTVSLNTATASKDGPQQPSGTCENLDGADGHMPRSQADAPFLGESEQTAAADASRTLSDPQPHSPFTPATPPSEKTRAAHSPAVAESSSSNASSGNESGEATSRSQLGDSGGASLCITENLSLPTAFPMLGSMPGSCLVSPLAPEPDPSKIVSLKIIISDDPDEQLGDPVLASAVSSITNERIPTIILSSPAKSPAKGPGLVGCPITPEETVQAVSCLQRAEVFPVAEPNPVSVKPGEAVIGSPVVGLEESIQLSLSGSTEIQQEAGFIQLLPASTSFGASGNYFIVADQTAVGQTVTQPKVMMLPSNAAMGQVSSASRILATPPRSRPLISMAQGVSQGYTQGSTLFISSPVQPMLQSMMVPVSVVGQNNSGKLTMPSKQQVKYPVKPKLKPKLAPKASTDTGKPGTSGSDLVINITGLEKHKPGPLLLPAASETHKPKPAGPSQTLGATDKLRPTEAPLMAPSLLLSSSPQSLRSHRRVLCFDVPAPEEHSSAQTRDTHAPSPTKTPVPVSTAAPPITPTAPAITPTAPANTPTAPAITPTAPAITPTAPATTPTAPATTPTAPATTPTAPATTPTAPAITPTAPPASSPDALPKKASPVTPRASAKLKALQTAAARSASDLVAKSRQEAGKSMDKTKTAAAKKDSDKSTSVPRSGDGHKGAPSQSDSVPRTKPPHSGNRSDFVKPEESRRSSDLKKKSQTLEKRDDATTSTKKDATQSSKPLPADHRTKSKVTAGRKETDHRSRTEASENRAAKGKEGRSEKRSSSQEPPHVTANKENELEGRKSQEKPTNAPPTASDSLAAPASSAASHSKTSPLTKQATEMLQDIQGQMSTSTPSKRLAVGCPELPLPRTPGSGRHSEEPLDCLRTPVRQRHGKEGEGTPRHLPPPATPDLPTCSPASEAGSENSINMAAHTLMILSRAAIARTGTPLKDSAQRQGTASPGAKGRKRKHTEPHASPPGKREQQQGAASPGSKKKAKKQKKLLDSFPDDLDVDKFLSSLHYDE
ncbi:protein NPAT isoform X2 [Amia ocellicauda]